MYRKIDHIGIAVRSLTDSLKVYREGLGLREMNIEEVPHEKTRVAMIPVGESRLELLEATDPYSPVARFISRRGEGLHHICFQVDDVFELVRKLKGAGLRLIDDVPRLGANHCMVAFVHPSSTGGVLVELSQPMDPVQAQDS